MRAFSAALRRAVGADDDFNIASLFSEDAMDRAKEAASEATNESVLLAALSVGEDAHLRGILPEVYSAFLNEDFDPHSRYMYAIAIENICEGMDSAEVQNILGKSKKDIEVECADLLTVCFSSLSEDQDGDNQHRGGHPACRSGWFQR